MKVSDWLRKRAGDQRRAAVTLVGSVERHALDAALELEDAADAYDAEHVGEVAGETDVLCECGNAASMCALCAAPVAHKQGRAPVGEPVATYLLQQVKATEALTEQVARLADAVEGAAPEDATGRRVINIVRVSP